jgi:hypothetical protein
VTESVKLAYGDACPDLSTIAAVQVWLRPSAGTGAAASAATAARSQWARAIVLLLSYKLVSSLAAMFPLETPLEPPMAPLYARGDPYTPNPASPPPLAARASVAVRHRQLPPHGRLPAALHAALPGLHPRCGGGRLAQSTLPTAGQTAATWGLDGPNGAGLLPASAHALGAACRATPTRLMCASRRPRLSNPARRSPHLVKPPQHLEGRRRAPGAHFDARSCVPSSPSASCMGFSQQNPR